jgi:protein tyrosine/serine phosphatase
MARRPLLPVAAALLLPMLLALLVGCHTVGTRQSGIDNFAVVQDGPEAIYRGAQPSEVGIQTLAARHVQTVINLRDDPVRDEQKWVEGAEMRYVQIPSSACRVEPLKVRQFLKEVQTSPRPVFVHCAQGRDRTGLEIAVYRIVVQNWSREEAIDELYAHGYHWALFPGIARYLKTFDPARFTAPAPPLVGG